MPNGVMDVEILVGLETIRTGVHGVMSAALRAFWCSHGARQADVLRKLHDCVEALDDLTGYHGSHPGRCTEEEIEIDGACVPKRPVEG